MNEIQNPEMLLESMQWRAEPLGLIDDISQSAKYYMEEGGIAKECGLLETEPLYLDMYPVGSNLATRALERSGGRTLLGFIVRRTNWGKQPIDGHNVSERSLIVRNLTNNTYLFAGHSLSEEQVNSFLDYLDGKVPPVGSGPHAGFSINVLRTDKLDELIKSDDQLLM